MLCAEEEPRFQRTRMHCEKLMFSEAAPSPRYLSPQAKIGSRGLHVATSVVGK